MEEKALFFEDLPIEVRTDDHFKASTYVDALRRIVLNCPTPFHIGLFGKWGVGKSSIAGILGKELVKDNENKVAVVNFDAWKYAGDSLRREVLRAINAALPEHERHTDEELDEELYSASEEEFTTSERDEESSRPKLSWYENLLWGVGRLYKKHSLAIKIVFFVVLAIIYIFLAIKLERDDPLLEVIRDSIWPLVLLIIGILLDTSIRQATKVIRRRKVITRVEYPEQFRAAFEKMCAKFGEENERIIFIIDNLDRTDPERVTETLSTVKTFLEEEKCVYLIPCDDEALKKHLSKSKLRVPSREDGDEFLKKFFQVTVRIDPPIHTDFRTFTEDLIQKVRWATDENLPQVSEVLFQGERYTPRTAKEFLNRITAAWLLAKQRESSEVRALEPDTVSTNIGFLAKILMIQEQWPEFHEKIDTDPYRWDESESVVEEVYPTGSSDTPKTIIEKKLRLRSFLSNTRHIQAVDIRPFLRLSIPPYEMGRREVSEFRDALARQQVASIRKVLERESESDRVKWLRVACDTMDQHQKHGRRGSWAATARSLIECQDIIPPLDVASVANKVANCISYQGVPAEIAGFNIEKTFGIIAKSQEPFRREALAKYVEYIEKGDEVAAVLNAFAANSDIVEGSAVTHNTPAWRVANSITNRFEKNEAEISGTLMNWALPKEGAQDEWANARKKYISDKLLIKILQKVEKKDANKDKKQFEFYLGFRDVAKDSAKKAFAQVMKDLLSVEPPATHGAFKGVVFAVLNFAKPQDFGEGLSEIVNTLITVMKSMAAGSRHMYVLQIILLGKGMSGDMKKAIDQALELEIKRLDPLNLIAWAKDETVGKRISKTDSLTRALIDRGKGALPFQHLRPLSDAIYAFIKGTKLSLCVPMTISHIQTTQEPAVSDYGLNSVSHYFAKKNDHTRSLIKNDDWRAIFDAIWERIKTLPAPDAYTTLGLGFDLSSGDQKRKVMDKAIESLTKPGSQRQPILVLVRNNMRVFSDAEKKRFAQQLNDRLKTLCDNQELAEQHIDLIEMRGILSSYLDIHSNREFVVKIRGIFSAHNAKLDSLGLKYFESAQQVPEDMISDVIADLQKIEEDKQHPHQQRASNLLRTFSHDKE